MGIGLKGIKQRRVLNLPIGIRDEMGGQGDEI